MFRIARIIVVIAGLSIAFLGLLAGALSFALPPIMGREIDMLRATTGASFTTLGLGLGLPLAWQGLNSLRGRPSRAFRPPRAWVLVAAFVVAVILGQAVLAFDLLPALTFPPFHVLGAALPPLFFLAFVGRSLADGNIRWREVVLQLASGAFLSTFGAFSSVAVLGLLTMVIVLTLTALTPGGAAWFQELSAHLQDPRWFQNPENAYSILFSPPIIIAFGLTVLVIIPLTEEMFKSLGVVIMSYRRPSRARAFLWGLASGAGFALAEGLSSGALSLDDWGGAAVLRIGVAAMHCLGGGLMGLGWHYLFATRRPWHLLGAYAISASLHFFWNAVAFGLIIASSPIGASAIDEVGLVLRSLTILVLMVFLSLLALFIIFMIFWLTRWLQKTIPPAQLDEASRIPFEFPRVPRST